MKGAFLKVPSNGLHGHGLALIHDLPASIVVFLVALPVCMGIAIAFGAPPAMGLITDSIVGIVGLLAGCPLHVSGPTNLLTGVMVGIGLAIAKLGYTTQNLEVGWIYKRETDSMHLEVMGIATFVSQPRLATSLEKCRRACESGSTSSRCAISIMCVCIFWNRGKMPHESNGAHVIVDCEELKARSYQGRRRQRATLSQAAKRRR